MKNSTKHNFLNLDKKYSEYKTSLVVLNFLSESGKTKSSSPESKIIKSSYKLSKFDEEMNREACYDFGIATLHQTIASRNSTKIIDNISSQIVDKKLPIIVAPSDELSLPLTKNILKEYSNSCVVLSSKFNALLLSDKLNKGKARAKLLHVGGRNFSKLELEQLRGEEVTFFLSREIRLGMYQNNWAQLIANNLTGKVFIYLDVSVFDPSVLASSKEPGGLFWDETLNLLKIIIQDKSISGIALTGYSSGGIDQISAYLISKLIYKIISYL